MAGQGSAWQGLGMADLLSALRTYLIGLGLVRNPATAGSVPPLWLEPKTGVPAPGEAPPGGNATNVGDPLVLGAFLSGGVARGSWEGWHRTWTVSLRIRSRTGLQAKEIEAPITAAIVDRRGWTMGGLGIVESLEWSPLSPITIDDEGFDYAA